MPKLVRIALSGLAFLVFNVGAAFLSWVLVPHKLWRTRKLAPAQRRLALDRFYWACNRWIVGVIRRFGLIRFEAPSVPPEVPRDRPFVLVANHPTLVDVLLIKATLPGITCVVKSSRYHRFHLRRMLAVAGDFPGPVRTSIGETAVLDIFVERLNKGYSVLVFPEGTRSPAWGLRRFHRGASEAAIRAGVAIVPVYISCDPPFLLKEDRWFDVRATTPRIELEFLPIIPTEGRDSRSLTRQLSELYRQKLEAQRHADQHVPYPVDSATPMRPVGSS